MSHKLINGETNKYLVHWTPLAGFLLLVITATYQGYRVAENMTQSCLEKGLKTLDARDSDSNRVVFQKIKELENTCRVRSYRRLVGF